jgi:hypothetical protein
MSRERLDIIRLISIQSVPPTPKEIADLLGRDRVAVRQNLRHMTNDGQLVKVGRGYVVALPDFCDSSAAPSVTASAQLSQRPLDDQFKSPEIVKSRCDSLLPSPPSRDSHVTGTVNQEMMAATNLGLINPENVPPTETHQTLPNAHLEPGIQLLLSELQKLGPEKFREHLAPVQDALLSRDGSRLPQEIHAALLMPMGARDGVAL